MPVSAETILKEDKEMLTIKVLGPGCDNCKKVEAAARRAVAQLGVGAEVIKVTR